MPQPTDGEIGRMLMLRIVGRWELKKNKKRVVSWDFNPFRLGL